MNIVELYNIYTQYPNVVTDTRNCVSNSIFFALKGANFNGNEYAQRALELGCKYAIVDEEAYAKPESNILLVDNVLETLQSLASYHRDQFKIPVIGITGTNGKTTTKELVTSVLSQEFKVLSTQGNLNNHIGVPLTLLKLTKEHEIAVIEMGANHMGEIAFLCSIAKPTFGLITNVGRAHIEGFGSFENIIKTKGELYEYIRQRNDSKIFIDYNNPYLVEIAQGLTTIYYGTEEDLFVTGKVVANNPCLVFAWKFTENYHTVQTNLIGEYNLSNILSSVAIGKYFGVRTEKIVTAIENYKPINHRSQLTKTDKNTLIIDAYNANPTSMSAAISNLTKIEATNKVLILGDMRELGEDSLIEHQKIVDQALKMGFLDVFLIGSEFFKTVTNYNKFETLDSYLDFLQRNEMSDKFILIKGSRGLQLEKCIEYL